MAISDTILGMKKQEIPAGFFFRESDHAYFMDGKKMTGVTTILGTIAKPALIGWAARMAVEYVRENFHLALDVNKQVLTEIFEKILNEALNAHTKKKEAGATAGTDTHALVEEYIKKCIAENKGLPFAVNDNNPILDFQLWAMRQDLRFIASEEKLYSKSMFYAGTADFIFEKDGKRYIGDVKTYKKLWDRVPMLQCAGYGLAWREMNGKDIDGYCVFNLPKEREFKEEEDVKWSYDVAGDQEGFLAALSLYRVLANW